MDDLLEHLRGIVGPRHVLTGRRATRRFCKGYRFGEGPALAVVCPGSLVEQWRVLSACIGAGAVVILQGANTGLTGGSSPLAGGYDRPAVIVSTLRIDRIDILGDGAQVLCLPGARLDALERRLRPLGRAPHSVIGSTSIGATVAGGVCNNSGGALIRRGPAYTELALFARVTAEGRLELVNHLGIDLGTGPEAILSRLDRGDYAPQTVAPVTGARASDRDYAAHVLRDVDAPTPARYNANPRQHHEVSGSAGHLAVFALRLDTFPAEPATRVFYIGTRNPDELESLRRAILSGFETLPIAGEYLHAGAYDLCRRYGKDLFLFLKWFGSARIPRAYAAKSAFDALTERLGLGDTLSDHLLQGLMRLLPEHLPRRLNDWHRRYPHHLMIRTDGAGIAELRAHLAAHFPSPDGDFFECTPPEGEAAFRLRFALGGAQVRYRAVHRRTVEDIVALDIALPRNARDWFETLPPELAEKVVLTSYCGHFFCHVMHHEYLVKKGEDCLALEHRMRKILDRRGARYPAEHNVGHLYPAGAELEAFYRRLDPTNSLNPGTGQTSARRNWAPEGDAAPP